MKTLEDRPHSGLIPWRNRGKSASSGFSIKSDDLKLKWRWKLFKNSATGLKAGLHRNANTNMACENAAYVHVGKFVDCSAFAEGANQPYINVFYANSLWCIDSRRIAFGCSPNIRHTAKCCLPRLRNMSTSNIHIVFACRILFAFRCKRGLMI